MVWMVEVDHLRSQVEQDKNIQIGAVWHHFTQWLVRLSHKQGRDALSREKEGSRTQAQLAKRSLGVEPVFEAPVVARQVKNEEGQVLDMFDENQVEDFDLTIREKQLNEKVLGCLKQKFPDEYEFYNRLYLDKLYQKYPSVTAWSKAIDMPERRLRLHLDKMTRKLQSFGRDLFLS
jgi:transcriptional regulator of aromatic amino acid metabolism